MIESIHKTVEKLKKGDNKANMNYTWLDGRDQGAKLVQEPPRLSKGGEESLLRIITLNVNNENAATPEGFVCEAILILTPGGKTMLIDSSWPSDFVHPNGKEPSYGTNLILSFLRQRGISTIDWMMASHIHDDHIGGMPEILLSEDVEVKAFLWSPVPDEKLLEAERWAPIYIKMVQEIREGCAKKKIPMIEVKQAEMFDLGDGVFGDVLSVAEPELEVPNYINNNSIVTRLIYKDFSMMLAGDSGFEQEDRIMALGKDLTSDVLKIGHHAGAGSTSEAWAKAVNARVGVASMPRGLSVNNPNGERVYNQLKATSMEIYRTWEYGHIEIQTDGTQYWVITER